MKIYLTIFSLLLLLPLTSALPICYHEFIRGDADNSNSVNLADAVYILSYLFSNGTAPSCFDAADINNDESVSVADSVFLLGYLFPNGNPPNVIPSPFPNAGTDESCDGINNDGDAFIDESCPYSSMWDIDSQGAESVEGIIKASDGKYWSVGNNATRIIVRTFLENGTQVNKYSYNFTGTTKGYSIAQYPDGFVIVGETNGHGLVMKINSRGYLMMSSIYQNSAIEKYNDVIQTTDGNFLIVGRGYGTATTTQENIWLMKTTYFGAMLWNKNISNVGFDELRSVVESSDGYISVGVRNLSGIETGYVIKYNTNGNFLWDINFTGTQSEFNNIVRNGNEFYLIGSRLNSDWDVLASKINNSGNELWTQEYDFGVNERGEDLALKENQKIVAVAKYTSGGLDRLLGISIELYGTLIDSQIIENQNNYKIRAVEYSNPLLTIGGEVSSSGKMIRQIFI